MHYLCDESDDWNPDIADIESKITPRTKAIVVINPNNPTGAVYSQEVLSQIVALARKHSLLLLADEIYDKILYDDAKHISLATLAPDLLCLTFNGLSKAYRVAGYRSGWMTITGPKEHAAGFLEGVDLLASTRLCPNVPVQHAIQVALGGYQSIEDLILPGGRLGEGRRYGPVLGRLVAAGDVVEAAAAAQHHDDLGYTDGVGLDAEGNLWVCLPAANKVVAITPSGQVETVCHDPSGATINHPTNVTWGGPDLRDLYIGSIRATYVLKARSPVPGLAMLHQR